MFLETFRSMHRILHLNPKLSLKKWSKMLTLHKVDEANVDTSNFVESSSRWVWALEARACQWLRSRTKEFEIIKMGVEESVDLGLGLKNSLLPNVVL